MFKSLAEDLRCFIRYNTVCNRSNARFAAEIGRFLKRDGFRVFYQKVKRGGELFVNVIGIKGGDRTKRPLLLCSHLDTVPSGDPKKWTRTRRDPWKAVLSDGHVYGLGAADDKGPLTSMLHAARRFEAKLLKRPLILMGTFGEENGMGGARRFIRFWKGPKPLVAIVGEPTSLSVTYRHKGMGVIVVELQTTKALRVSRSHVGTSVFKGRQAHSSRPWLGDNALDKAGSLLQKLFDEDPDSYFLSLEGGHAANIIPDRAELRFLKSAYDLPLVTYRKPKRGYFGCFPVGSFLDCYNTVQQFVLRMSMGQDDTFRPPVITSNFGVARTRENILALTFDFRLLPGQSITQIFREIEKELQKKIARYPDIRWKMKIERDNPPLDLRASDAWPRFSKKLLKESGLPVDLSVKPACTEAGLYRKWGVPAVVFGPGESGANIHAPNEKISLKQMEKATQFYEHAIRKICVEEAV
jgi:acetylornithine deacetylase/succinyl-diaminopimelate desuccinylase-like protein